MYLRGFQSIACHFRGVNRSPRRTRRWKDRRRILIGGVGWVVWALVPASPSAARAEAEGPAVEESFAVGALFRTAQDAIERQDWKLAIDSLQRVIDAPEGLVAVESKSGGALERYVSPRWHAQRLLASLPMEGLQSYRVLNDGRASALLIRGRRDADLDALRELCDRYAASSHGQDGVTLLASLLLDRGRASEALQIMQNHASIFHAGRPLPATLALKRAAALILLGDAEGGRAALEEVRAASDVAALSVSTIDAVAALAVGQSVVDGARRAVWSGPLGGGRCDGRMDAVVPSFAERLPWRRTIPSAASGRWPELDGLAVNMLPASLPALFEGRLYVRAGMEIAALDVASFSLLWESDSGAAGIAERAETRGRWTLAGERSLLSDYVTGSLTVGDGHVYAVEREGGGAAFEADGVLVIQPRNLPRQAPRTEGDIGNRLVAYREDSGAPAWRRGGEGEVDQRLQHVQFLAPPVSSGGRLWVPFESGGDLFVGVLNPADGSMVQQIVLCALGGRDVEPTTALFAAEADGVLYVPTGHGLLFALSVKEASILWASRYAENSAPANIRMRGPSTSGIQAPQEWLSGPPTVAGRWVVLAPTDVGELIAFDRLDGEVGWRSPRMKHRYLVGNDGASAWLGGNHVSRVSLQDGTYLWTTAIEEPTGRAALCGELLYVPTRKDVTAVDAVSGAVATTYALPSDQPPLGNLYCTGGSMISIDPSEVRAFPDRHSYASTLAAHRARPADAPIGIRLAFMELLEGRPEAALEVLEGVDAEPGAGLNLQKEHVAHLRVRALLQLGSAASMNAGSAVEYLQRAVASAMNEQDRVSSRMALGEKLRKLNRHVEAYRTLWSLSQESVAETTLARGTVEMPARLAIADTLRRIEPELGPSDVEDIHRDAEDRYRRGLVALGTAATRREGVRALRALADGGTLGGWSQRALTALGRHELERGRFEQAEQYLWESVRRGSATVTGGYASGGSAIETSEALLLLVDLYRHPAQGLSDSANDAVARLFVEHGDVEVGGESVRALLERRGVRGTAAPAPEPMAFELTRRAAYKLNEDSANERFSIVPRLMVPRGTRGRALEDRHLTYLAPRTIRAHGVDDGRLLWESELFVTPEFSFESEGADEAAMLRQTDAPTLMADGQTGLICGPEGWHAIGLRSGKRVWAKGPRTRALELDMMLRNSTTDVGSGRAVCMLSPGVMTVLGMVDGEVIWSRRVDGDTLVARIRDDVVLTAGPGLERVEVLRLEDGEKLAEPVFRQPHRPDRAWTVPLAYVDGALCGPDGDGVTAYDVRTGERLWSMVVEGGPAGIIDVAGGRLVVAAFGGRHSLVEARSGRMITSCTLEGLPNGAVYGIGRSDPRGPALVLAGVEESPEGERWTFAGVQEDGRMKWSRTLVGPMPRSNLDDRLAVIPFVVTGDDGSGRVMPDADARFHPVVVLLDMRTGENVGEPFPWMGSGNIGQLEGPLEAWPGRLVMQGSRCIVTYETRVARGSRGVN